MAILISEKQGQHKFETRRHKALPYIALGASCCLLTIGVYLSGEQKGEDDALETRIVGRTLDGYLADNDTFRNRRFLEVFAKSNSFRFLVTTPDKIYKCDGTYGYDEGRVYINEQQITCNPVESPPAPSIPPVKI